MNADMRSTTPRRYRAPNAKCVSMVSALASINLEHIERAIGLLRDQSEAGEMSGWSLLRRRANVSQP